MWTLSIDREKHVRNCALVRLRHKWRGNLRPAQPWSNGVNARETPTRELKHEPISTKRDIEHEAMQGNVDRISLVARGKRTKKLPLGTKELCDVAGRRGVTS